MRRAGWSRPGRVKIVNHPRGGRVAQIHVREGDHVDAGAVARHPRRRGRAQRAQPSSLGRLEVRTGSRSPGSSRRGRAGATMRVEPTLASLHVPSSCRGAAHVAARPAAAAQASRHESLQDAEQTRRGELRTAAAEVGRLRNSLALIKQQREAVKRPGRPRPLSGPQGRGRSSGSTATTSASWPRPRPTLDAAKSALGRGPEPACRPGAPSGAPTVLAELATATADRDRLAEQLRAQDVILQRPRRHGAVAPASCRRSS